MKCKYFVLLGWLISLFINPMLSLALTSSSSSYNATQAQIPQNKPNIAVSFMFTSGTVEAFAAQNPTLIFFTVANNATSTISSDYLTHAMELLLKVNLATLEQLTNAIAGVELENTNYIVLDISAIPSLILGGYIVNHESLPGTLAWVQALTVLQASELDSEFFVIAYNQNGQGTASSFADAPAWAKAFKLKIWFKSAIYPILMS